VLQFRRDSTEQRCVERPGDARATVAKHGPEDSEWCFLLRSVAQSLESHEEAGVHVRVAILNVLSDDAGEGEIEGRRMVDWRRLEAVAEEEVV
jgi:hypothetical protein